MPIFEYLCRTCRRHFELLLFGSEHPVCPSCAGTDLEKQLSRFAVSSSGSRPGGAGSDPGTGSGAGPGACGSCGDPRGPGACDLD